MAGGYEMDPVWLARGRGYTGVIKSLDAKHASVELDAELVLTAPDDHPWQDFGTGSKSARQEVAVASGRWLTLSLAYAGAEWKDPIDRLHVGLCDSEPDLTAIPAGGGVGYVGLLARNQSSPIETPVHRSTSAKAADPGCLPNGRSRPSSGT